MPSVFDQQFATAAFSMLLSQFGEKVTYHPHGGVSREIDAIVERLQVQLNPEDGDTLSPVFNVQVLNAKPNGIKSEELNVGGDSIELVVRIGEQPSQRRVLRLLSHHGGVIDLECR
jgi:hypothetical protein